MGYIRHHAIVVTGSDFNDHIEQARKSARALGMSVTEIVDSPVNGYRTFAVVPDGSKEGWGASDYGDEARDLLIEWLKTQHYNDGSSSLSYCEVQYGDDEGENTVLRTDDDEWRRVQGVDS